MKFQLGTRAVILAASALLSASLAYSQEKALSATPQLQKPV